MSQPPKVTPFPTAPAVRQPGTLADMPGAARDPLAPELARIERAYGRWITANQLAAEEGCSVDTARRHLLAGAYGRPVDRQPGGGLRILTITYLAALRARTVPPR